MLVQPTQLLLVGIGGGLGAIARFLLAGWIMGWVQPVPGLSNPFPIGTLAVNLLGCLLIGILSQLGDSRAVFTPESRTFLFTGILGGFTTFSTFSNETVNLIRAGQASLALLSVGAHLLLGLAAVWFGRWLMSLLLS